MRPRVHQFSNLSLNGGSAPNTLLHIHNIVQIPTYNKGEIQVGVVDEQVPELSAILEVVAPIAKSHLKFIPG